MSNRLYQNSLIRRYTACDYMNMVGKVVEEVFKDKDCLIIFFGSVARGGR